MHHESVIVLISDVRSQVAGGGIIDLDNPISGACDEILAVWGEFNLLWFGFRVELDDFFDLVGRLVFSVFEGNEFVFEDVVEGIRFLLLLLVF